MYNGSEQYWQVRYTEDGGQFRVCGVLDPMANLEPWMNCVFYLYPDIGKAKRGEAFGGCGFWIAKALEIAGWYQLYAVTAAHVLADCGKAPVMRVNRRDGEVGYEPSSLADWHVAKDDDLAVWKAELTADSLYVPILSQHFITQELLLETGTNIGAETFMIGRFVTHEGRQKNLPTARSGMISMMPYEPIRTKKNKLQDAFLQDTFLVECRSIPGYSGSPVFLVEPPFHLWSKAAAIHKITRGPHLLGLDWGHLREFARAVEKDQKTLVKPEILVPVSTAMAGVVPAWKLLELLDRDDIAMQRKKDEQKIRKQIESQPSPMALDSARPVSVETQTTAEGHEIPIPTKDQFFDDLKKSSRKKG